jgi:acylphosphatase
LVFGIWSLRMIKAYSIKVRGDVQGVFYRHNAKIMADKLGIVGWVKNKQDGSVKVLIQGEEEKLKKFIEWAYEGSPMATVENVEITALDTDKDMNKFEIR